MPKVKKGLNYFDIDTDINNDMRVKLLSAEFGVKGFGIWMQLLIQIYGDEGFFMKWDKDTKLMFASDVGAPGGLVDEVVNGAVRRGLFNESVFNSLSILTSKHIQEKYFGAIKRRESELKVDARYLVIPCNVDIIKCNVNIKLLNVNRTEQSRVEESRVESARARKKPKTGGNTGNPHLPVKAFSEKVDEQRAPPVVIDAPKTVAEVIEIGNMKAIPQDQCEIYFHLRATDNFQRQNKHGDWKPILNWHADLVHLYKKGALKSDIKNPEHDENYGKDDGWKIRKYAKLEQEHRKKHGTS